MKFSLKQALSFCFSDKEFAQKMLIGCGFLILSMLINNIIDTLNNVPKNITVIVVALFLAVVSIISTLIPYGYEVENSHLRLIQNEITLCDWKNKLQKLKYGFLSCFIPCLSWGLVMILIGFIFGFGAGFLHSLLLKVTQGYLINIYLAFAFIALFFILLFTIILVEASRLSYITDLKFKSFFNLKAIKKIMFENFRKYVNYMGNIIILGFIQIAVLFVLAFVVNILAQFIAVVLSAAFTLDDVSKVIANVLYVLTFSPVIMYFYFVYSDFKAQFLKLTLQGSDER